MNYLYKEIDFEISKRDRITLKALLKKAKAAEYIGAYGEYNTNQEEVFFQTFFRDWNVNYMKKPLFKKLEILLKDIQDLDVARKAQIIKVTGSLVPHVDPRSCVLSIPIHKTSVPITWYNDDGSVLHKYHYTKFQPVLINTHVSHGCPENNKDRYLFQIGIGDHLSDFRDVIKLIEGT